MSVANKNMSDSLVIKSPFQNNINIFDCDEDDASFPDLKVNIPGMEKPLNLHRSVLGRASDMMLAMFRTKSSAYGKYDESARRIDWPDESENITNPEALDRYYKSLEKWLRFCYGEDWKIEDVVKDCPAALVTLFQLELECEEQVKKDLIRIIVNEMKKGMENCIKLQLCRMEYHEFYGDKMRDKKIT